MTVYELSISRGYQNRVTQNTLHGLKKPGSGKGVTPEAHNPAGPVDVTTYKNDLNKIRKINDTFNTVATNIRSTVTALDIIQKKVDRMHNQLKAHIKNYPPFLPGSEERVKFLKSLNTFRKQIDALTFPPEYEFAKRILADPAVVPGAGDWEIILGENGPYKTIYSKESHTGPTGLDIPELPLNADDVTIEVAIVRMKNAKTTLKQFSGDLFRDISEIGKFKQQGTPADDFPDAAAEPKSIHVQLALADLPGMKLTASPANLIDLLDN